LQIILAHAIFAARRAWLSASGQGPSISGRSCSEPRVRLVELQLLAYQAPIYQMLALPGSRTEVAPSPAAVVGDRETARAHLARLLAQLERRRDRL